MQHKLSKSFGTRMLALLALCTAAAAQSVVVEASDPANGDGTLWYRSFAGSTSGGVQLANHRIYGGGALAGIHFAKFKWNTTELRFEDGLYVSTPAAFTSQKVEIAAGVPLAPCLGAATFNAGFIVNEDAAGVATAIRPHVGALVWTSTNLYAVEAHQHAGTAGAVVIQPILAGTFHGVVVLSSKIEDLDTGVAADSHIIATALAYTTGNVFRIDVDMSDLGGIAFSAVAVPDPAGAAITQLRGATSLNSGFKDSLVVGVPSTPEGAAALWNGNHVWMFEHRSTGDTLTEVLNILVAPNAPISGCWGVMSLFCKSQPGPLNPTLDNLYEIFSGSKTFLASGSSAGEEIVNGEGSFQTDVVIGSPLIKRQATCLYEIMGRSTLAADQGRGMVIGHNQRSQ